MKLGGKARLDISRYVSISLHLRESYQQMLKTATTDTAPGVFQVPFLPTRTSFCKSQLSRIGINSWSVTPNIFGSDVHLLKIE